MVVLTAVLVTAAVVGIVGFCTGVVFADRKPPCPTTVVELQRLLPDSAIEVVHRGNDYGEVVIYTGWSQRDGDLVPYDDAELS